MNARAAASRWADTWRRAWEASDVDAVVGLYADHVVFSSQPFRTPHRGRHGVRDYVSAAFGEEEQVRAWFGTPVVDGERASVEWWASLRENGVEITLAGASVLRFDASGLVTAQRDTWSQADGLREPPGGWGR